MSPEQVLAALEQLADRLEIPVDYAAIATEELPGHGGLCVLRGERRIIIERGLQLTTDERISIDVAGLPFETCSKCRRVKYLPHTRGFFPGLLAEPACGAVKTNEYFGSGARAYQGVLISQAVGQGLDSAGVRGASFHPVSED